MADLYDSLVAAGLMTKEQADAARKTATPTGSGTSTKPLKSGTYTSTETSSRIPNDDALQGYADSVFQKYYGRNASQTELASLLPELKKQYTSKSGQTKSTVKRTYKAGNLVNTEYLTAEGIDPKTWLDSKVQGQLESGNQVVNKLGIPEGPAGKYFVTIKNLAADNGLNLSDAAAQKYATDIASGVIDDNTAYNTIRESAANAFPALGDKIKQGINLKTLADPYIQSMSNILEIPDTGIDLFDPKIRSAMAFTTPDGKVGTKSIYDFEKELRQDPRWQYTNNARQQASSVATTVLKDFGFMG
jgi:hypothetical protein